MPQRLLPVFIVFLVYFSQVAAAGFRAQETAFIENKGQFVQTDSHCLIRFKAEFPSMDIYLTDKGITYVFKQRLIDVGESGQNASLKTRPSLFCKTGETGMQLLRVDMNVLKGNATPHLVPSQRCEEEYNYYRPGCPQGINGVSAYRKITYKSIYPNIDWVINLKGNGIEHEFIIYPGGNPRDIALNYEGAKEVLYHDDGSLRIRSAMGYITEQRPFTYYKAEGKLNKLKSSFERRGVSTAGYSVANFENLEYPVVIDPFLTWSCYFGGNGADLSYVGMDHVIDAHNNYWYCSFGPSTDMPVTPGVIQSLPAGNADLYIAKFSPSGELKMLTYYGGTLDEYPYAMGIDSNSRIFIAGTTLSTDFPVSSGVFQSTFAGVQDGFLLKMDTAGNRDFSTFYGGSANDYFISLSITPKNDIWLVGASNSADFPVSAGAFQTAKGAASDGIIVRFTDSGTRIYSTFYGGSAIDEIWGVDATSTSDVWMAGSTQGSSGLATPGAFQVTYGGGSYDPLIIRFTDANTRAYASYYGGSGEDRFYSCVVDKFDNAWFGGYTKSNNFSTTPGAFQSLIGGNYDGCFLKFDSSNTRKLASYYGGPNEDYLTEICADRNGNILFSGGSKGSGFPVTINALQPSYQGGIQDAALLKLNNNGVPLYSSNHGGTDADIEGKILTDTSGDIYLIGCTKSVCSFPLFNPGNNAYFQDVKGLDYDQFISKFSDFPAQNFKDSLEIIVSKDSICPGDSSFLSFSFGNAGTTYTWSPSATLSSPNGSTVRAKPFSTTKYFVTAVNANGCSTKDSVTIVVMYSVYAGSDRNICPGDSIQLFATGDVGYVWNPSPTLTNDTIPDPFAKPADTTSYIVTGKSGNCGAKDTVTINVIRVVTNAGPDVNICLGDSVRLNASGANSYKWKPSTALSNDTLSNPYAKPLTSLDYLVIGTIDICSDNDTVHVHVSTIIADAGSDQFICPGDSARLNASGGTLYEWVKNPTLSDTSVHDPMARPTSTATYYVWIGNGICREMDSVTIHIINAIIPNAGTDTTICEGDSAGLHATGGTIYAWKTDTSLSDTTIADPIARPILSTRYIVFEISGTCHLTDTVEVFVNQVPTVSAGNDTLVCKGMPFTLQAFSDANEFLWEPSTFLDNNTVLNPIATPGDQITYTLKVTNTTTGCVNSDSVRIKISQPSALFSPDPFQGLKPLKVSFKDLSGPSNLLYLWDFGDTSGTSTNQNPEYIYTNPGIFKVLLIVTDTTGCTDSITYQIKVFDNRPLIIPNVFTPNNDPSNNVFEIDFEPGFINELKGIIRNRWGNLVYEFEMPGGNWWNGTYNGQQCPEGVYFYTIDTKDITGKKASYHGTITLIR